VQEGPQAEEGEVREEAQEEGQEVRTLARALGAAALIAALAPAAAPAATIPVDTNQDLIDEFDDLCSLREAVTSANTNAADANDCVDGESSVQDVISLDATGTYLLTGPGDEDSNNIGDLDVHTDGTGVRLSGDLDAFGHPLDIVDGDQIDRVLDVIGDTDVVVDGAQLDNGETTGNGGIIRAAGPGELSVVGGSVVTGGEAANGGGILKGSGGSLTVTDTEIQNNETNDDPADGSSGGGIRTEAPLTMTRSHVFGNLVTADVGDGALDFQSGGAVALFSGAEGTVITDSTLDNNAANAGEANDQVSGGALFVGVTPGGAVEVRGSTFEDNNVQTGSTRQGGAVYLINGDLRIINSTIANSGGATSGGSALHVAQSIAAATLDHVTLTANSGAPAVPLFHNGPVTLRGSIVDQTGIACQGLEPLTTNAYNLDRGTSCVGAAADADLPNMNANLEAPAFPDAFPPAIWDLPAGSPAIDVEPVASCVEPDGTTPLLIDQRGVDRPVGPACDAGAVERVVCNGLEPTILGGPTSETLTGTAGPDVIYGSGGADTVAGGAGADALCGGSGADTLLAQDGAADTLDCGTGADSYAFDAGLDSLVACETDLNAVPPKPDPVVTKKRCKKGQKLKKGKCVKKKRKRKKKR
jgi:hypothetical protein